MNMNIISTDKITKKIIQGYNTLKKLRRKSKVIFVQRNKSSVLQTPLSLDLTGRNNFKTGHLEFLSDVLGA